jgi:hypothetical protein
VERQHPGLIATGSRLEDKFAAAFRYLDCSSYIHSELCYYLLEVVYEDLKLKRKLSDLQQLLEAVAAAIGELVGEQD